MTAIGEALQTFIALEGMVFLAPFLLIGLWRQRRHPLLRSVVVFAILAHLLMTVVFPFPGMRGGLFHATAALFPIWMALAVRGLDDSIAWVAHRRRGWRLRRARRRFSAAALAFGVCLSLLVGLKARDAQGEEDAEFYRDLAVLLPADARVMINDPAKLYNYTGLGGVTLPNDPVSAIPAIAAAYEIDYLVLESISQDGYIGAAPRAFQFDVDQPPEFLRRLPWTGRG